MTDRIVDSDLNVSDGTSTEEISSQLEGEKVTSEEVQESNSEQQSEEKVVPPKFQGKSVDEILQSYQNLEQQYGKQGNELGELRKLADSLIQKNLQEAQDTPVQEQEKRLSEDDFLANPVDSVRKIVEEAIQPLKGALQ